MTKTLTHADIRKFLKNYAAAVRLDQRRVDALPKSSFHGMYDAKLWRGWRSAHVTYIGNLLPSVNAIPRSMLMELTEVAATYQLSVLEQVVLENFADAVSGACDKEEFATAERFFGWVLKATKMKIGLRRRRSSCAIEAIAKWLPDWDPLRIARDPECQYDLRLSR